MGNLFSKERRRRNQANGSSNSYADQHNQYSGGGSFQPQQQQYQYDPPQQHYPQRPSIPQQPGRSRFQEKFDSPPPQQPNYSHQQQQPIYPPQQQRRQQRPYWPIPAVDPRETPQKLPQQYPQRPTTSSSTGSSTAGSSRRTATSLSSNNKQQPAAQKPKILYEIEITCIDCVKRGEICTYTLDLIVNGNTASKYGYHLEYPHLAPHLRGQPPAFSDVSKADIRTWDLKIGFCNPRHIAAAPVAKKALRKALGDSAYGAEAGKRQPSFVEIGAVLRELRAIQGLEWHSNV